MSFEDGPRSFVKERKCLVTSDTSYATQTRAGTSTHQLVNLANGDIRTRLAPELRAG
jgi:hypothetical protein